MTTQPRVALFCETFQEINGVALTVRQLTAFAQRREHPFLVVHPGPRVAQSQEGSLAHLELPRSWASFGIESDLRYDLFLWRHLRKARETLEAFRPDLIHVTSPGEFGQLGAVLAHKLRIPLVASWHTNLHQFAARRLQKLLSFLPTQWSTGAASWAENASLLAILRFYRIARVTLAPTPEQVSWLEGVNNRPSFLMPRGVDCNQFNPRHRTVNDTTLRLGFVGRITPEKNVRLLVDIERALLAAGHTNFSIVVVGNGSEREWLQRNLQHGVLPGILRGHELAQAYANMDLFVFPSRTDTFGNVIQEAAASGVPSVVTSEGGPKNLVVNGITGLIAEDDSQFVQKAVELSSDLHRLRRMGFAARENTLGISWDAAFEMTYSAYRYCQEAWAVALHPGGKTVAPESQAPAA